MRSPQSRFCAGAIAALAATICALSACGSSYGSDNPVASPDAANPDEAQAPQADAIAVNDAAIVEACAATTFCESAGQPAFCDDFERATAVEGAWARVGKGVIELAREDAGGSTFLRVRQDVADSVAWLDKEFSAMKRKRIHLSFKVRMFATLANDAVVDIFSLYFPSSPFVQVAVGARGSDLYVSGHTENGPTISTAITTATAEFQTIDLTIRFEDGASAYTTVVDGKPFDEGSLTIPSDTAFQLRAGITFSGGGTKAAVGIDDVLVELE